jgi:hypothetical protein
VKRRGPPVTTYEALCVATALSAVGVQLNNGDLTLAVFTLAYTSLFVSNLLKDHELKRLREQLTLARAGADRDDGQA